MALTAAQAHAQLVRAAVSLSYARQYAPEFLVARKADYDFWYQKYTNPFNVPKHAPAITPTN